MNIINCIATNSTIKLAAGNSIEIKGKEVATKLGIRPEAISLTKVDKAHIKGVVDIVELHIFNNRLRTIR